MKFGTRVEYDDWVNTRFPEDKCPHEFRKPITVLKVETPSSMGRKDGGGKPLPAGSLGSAMTLTAGDGGSDTEGSDSSSDSNAVYGVTASDYEPTPFNVKNAPQFAGVAPDFDDADYYYPDDYDQDDYELGYGVEDDFPSANNQVGRDEVSPEWGFATRKTMASRRRSIDLTLHEVVQTGVEYHSASKFLPHDDLNISCSFNFDTSRGMPVGLDIFGVQPEGPAEEAGVTPRRERLIAVRTASGVEHQLAKQLLDFTTNTLPGGLAAHGPKDLTAEKLFISITSALRSFGQLKRLNDTRLGLELIVEAAGALFDDGTLQALADGALSHLKALLDLECEGGVIFRPSPEADLIWLAGSFEAEAELSWVSELFQIGVENGRPVLTDQHTILLVRTTSGAELLICLETTKQCDQMQCDLVSVLSSKLAIAIDKARLYEELRLQNAELERRVSARTADLSAVNQRLDAQAELLRRVNAFKNEILGTVAHDLKNPLAVILGRAEMLRTLAQDMAEPKATLTLAQVEHICTAARRMTRIVDVSISDALADALDIMLDRRKVDLAAIVRSTAALARTLCDTKFQTLEVSAPERLVACCDPDRTTEAIENLLSNAAKYAPLGGRISLTLVHQGAHAVVSVDDSGPGLTPEDAIRVFGRFQRLSAQPTGGETSTGLGLSIVRKIAELHGGRVEATEKGPLGGATFAIVLPLEATTS